MDLNKVKQKAFIGIDPGQTGAAALIHAEGEHLHDWQGIAPASSTIQGWRMEYNVCMVAIEMVHAMPKQGVTSTFNFGVNFGMWQGVLATLQMAYAFVRPQEWRKGLITRSDGQGKEAGLNAARRLFPDAELHLKKHSGRADALLIALWAKSKYDF